MLSRSGTEYRLKEMASLNKVLSKLKQNNEILSYEIELTSEMLTKDRAEATIVLHIDSFPIVRLQYLYNPVTRPTREIFNLLKEDLDERLVKTGIWSLLAVTKDFDSKFKVSESA